MQPHPKGCGCIFLHFSITFCGAYRTYVRRQHRKKQFCIQFSASYAFDHLEKIYSYFEAFLGLYHRKKPPMQCIGGFNLSVLFGDLCFKLFQEIGTASGGVFEGEGDAQRFVFFDTKLAERQKLDPLQVGKPGGDLHDL